MARNIVIGLGELELRHEQYSTLTLIPPRDRTHAG